MKKESKNNKTKGEEFGEILELPDVRGGASLLEAIKEVEDENADLKDRIKEERFIFGVGFVVLLNVVLFRELDGMACVVIGIMQLLVFLMLAQRSGVEEMARIAGSVFSAIVKK